jgi:hypothetical protein
MQGKNDFFLWQMFSQRYCIEMESHYTFNADVLLNDWYMKICAMVQAVSCQPVTAGTQIWSQASPCGIFGGKSCTGVGFPPNAVVFPCQYYSTNAVYSLIYHECYSNLGGSIIKLWSTMLMSDKCWRYWEQILLGVCLCAYLCFVWETGTKWIQKYHCEWWHTQLNVETQTLEGINKEIRSMHSRLRIGYTEA